jgi:uncharacterized protein (DUF433 family)
MSAIAEAVDIGQLIARTAGIKHGSAHIAGTGILVRTIARSQQEGLLAEEIAAKYRTLRLDQVHAALAYYYANKGAIDSELQALDRAAEELEKTAATRAQMLAFCQA